MEGMNPFEGASKDDFQDTIEEEVSEETVEEEVPEINNEQEESPKEEQVEEPKAEDKQEKEPKTDTPDFSENIKELGFNSFDDFKAAYESQKNEIEELKTPKAKRAYEENEDSKKFIDGLIDYYEKTGDLTPYLEAKTVDYDKLSHEQLLRRKMREEDPEMSDKLFELRFKKNVLGILNAEPKVPEEDADEAEIAKINEYNEELELQKEDIKYQADKYKREAKKRQAEFKAPEVTKEQEYDPKETERLINSDPVVKKLRNERFVTVKHGENEFNFETDPEDLIAPLMDSSKVLTLFSNEKGEFDTAKSLKIINYAKNMEAYENFLFNNGKTAGIDSVQKDVSPDSRTNRKNEEDGGEPDEKALMKEFAKAWN